MKKLILAGCMATLFACNNTNEFDSNLDAQVSNPAAASAAGAQPNGINQMPVINPASTPVNAAPVVSTPVQAQPAQVVQSTPAGTNPAHGQPGHRCDIAVGAPLNSPPAQNVAAKTATPQNVVVKPTISANPVKTAPGMNPAHGEPGHRCDIAVGAPLNSPVNKTGVTSQVTPLTPVKPEDSKSAADQWKVDIKKDSSRN